MARTLQNALTQHGLSVQPHLDTPGCLDLTLRTTGECIAEKRTLADIWEYIYLLEAALEASDPRA